MDVLEPFLLDFDNSRDFNFSEIDHQLNKLAEQRKLSIQFLRNESPLDVLLDCVSDFGVDSYDYLDLVGENIDNFVDGQIFIKNSNLILL